MHDSLSDSLFNSLPDSLHESATLYTLGMLDPRDKLAFEDRLALDPKLSALVGELERVTGAVLVAQARQTGLRPSPALKDRILARTWEVVQHRFPVAVVSALREAKLPPPQPGGVVAFADADGILDWVSPAFEEMCGYRLEEMRGRKAGSRLRGELSQGEAATRLHRAVHLREAVVQRIVNYRKDGTPYWVEINLRPVSAGFVASERHLGLAA